MTQRNKRDTIVQNETNVGLIIVFRRFHISLYITSITKPLRETEKHPWLRIRFPRNTH